MADKFNIAWQIVRTKARKIKDPEEKIAMVMAFLRKHPNIHNYERIHNWTRMTAFGYKGEQRKLFDEALEKLEKNIEKYSDEKDTEIDMGDVKDADLLMVHKDLAGRKYDFQYKSTPKAHTAFMEKLEAEMNRRGLRV